MRSLIRDEEIAKLHLNGKGGGMLTERSGCETVGGGLRVRIFERKKFLANNTHITKSMYLCTSSLMPSEGENATFPFRKEM